VWRKASWPRLAAVAALALLFIAAPHISALVLAFCVLEVIVFVAVLDRVLLASVSPD
jgi:hypothetical protein